MIKTGIFGGSFNPIHLGHIALAKCFLKEAELDEVWLMVSPQNPLKQSADLLDDERRLEMVRRAVEKEPGLVACDYEFRLPKPSYTWNTLQAIEKDFPERELTLLIGGDNWRIFPRWYKAKDILERYRIAVYPRGNEGGNANMQKCENTKVQILHAELIPVSSTEIRQRVRRGESVKEMVPVCIENMVIENYQKRS